MATISTHNGSVLSQGHNRRDEKYTSKDGHVKKNGRIEIWKDEDIREAYSRIFGSAQEEYNAKQKRADRKINDYFAKIKTDKKKNLGYEMIIGIYHEPNISDESKRAIMKEFVDTWQERNPQMEMIGAYYHADEQGEPHVHIDYIPVAHFERGMSVQNAMMKACVEMGFQNDKGIHLTPQAQWTREQNAYLEHLCNEKGIKVEHDTERKEHLSVREYQEVKERVNSIEVTSHEDIEIKMPFVSKKKAQKLQKENNQLKTKVEALENERTKLYTIFDVMKSKRVYKDKKNVEKELLEAKDQLLDLKLDNHKQSLQIGRLTSQNQALQKENIKLKQELDKYKPKERQKQNREVRHVERNRDDFDLEK